MDKVLRYENIIQAFSRTNRLFGPDKPFGTIRYYRYPNTMKANVDAAIKLYSGDKPIGLFVEKLEYNLNHMNTVFSDIQELFANAGAADLSKLPADKSERGKFASLYKTFNEHMEAAKIQGFTWNKAAYTFSHEQGKPETTVTMELNETTYLILAQRYKELFSGGDGNSSTSDDLPYDIQSNLIEIDTGRIDTNYMNSRFEKYLRMLSQTDVGPEELQHTLDELHKSFAVLNQEEQKFATIFLHDVESGAVQIESGKTFRDYVVIYEQKSKDDNISKVVRLLGVDENKLRERIASGVNESTINEFGRFDELRDSLDKAKAKDFFEKQEGHEIRPKNVNSLADKLLRSFILSGGYDIEGDESVNYRTDETYLLAASPKS